MQFTNQLVEMGHELDATNQLVTSQLAAQEQRLEELAVAANGQTANGGAGVDRGAPHQPGAHRQRPGPAPDRHEAGPSAFAESSTGAAGAPDQLESPTPAHPAGREDTSGRRPAGSRRTAARQDLLRVCVTWGRTSCGRRGHKRRATKSRWRRGSCALCHVGPHIVRTGEDTSGRRPAGAGRDGGLSAGGGATCWRWCRWRPWCRVRPWCPRGRSTCRRGRRRRAPPPWRRARRRAGCSRCSSRSPAGSP